MKKSMVGLLIIVSLFMNVTTCFADVLDTNPKGFAAPKHTILDLYR